MPAICKGVEFDTIVREWRCKWSPEHDKAALVALQQLLVELAPKIKATPGVKGVTRTVCGGCMDFKVAVAVDAAKFAAWEGAHFAPEADFIKRMSAIKGVSVVETQTYTLMSV